MPRSGSTSARGYGWSTGAGPGHQQIRKTWEPRVDSGQVECHANPCWMSDSYIQPGTPWDLGHSDCRTYWTGPEHRHCNRRNAALKGNKKRVHKTSWKSRVW